ncbi:MAG TPA: thiamine phosphate synthase [Smithellaceae bacterium]|nr:thiamine phosphate synthase [Smithellaceae bacterium]HRS81915.1 thiamine phosphate synthase [Smithellaceae bacterium]HRV44124.1 thiamine phosphate synthase [Smithellaceae bacterium]
MRGIYLVTDRALCRGGTLLEVVAQAVKGGTACVQLREKDLSTRAFVEEALAVKDILAPYQIPLIINDRIDVALAAGADGIHIGQEDMPYTTARRLMGPKAIIGLSVETWADVEASCGLDVDYLGISPVFATPTKTDTKEPWGLEGLTKIRAFSRHSLVAIGGISEANAREVTEAGADCLAVVSAICSAEDPAATTARLKDIFDEALRRRENRN